MVPFSDRHLAGAHALSMDLRWPYRIEDWAFALRLGHGVVLESASGDVIGTAAWFPCGETFATIGMIIVSGEAQGRGYGAKLMDAVLEAAGSRTFLLNSTPEGQALYLRRGFRPVNTIHQHQGIATAGFKTPAPEAVGSMTASDIETVLRLDAQANGIGRRPLLEALFEVGETLVLRRGDGPAGYVVSRVWGRGHVLGPVVAPTLEDARILIGAALTRLEGRFVRIDTEAGTGLSAWFDEIGLPKVSDALVMVRGTMPGTGPSRVFALSNQSLN